MAKFSKPEAVKDDENNPAELQQECIKIAQQTGGQLADLVAFFASEVGVRGIRATIDSLLGEGTYKRFATDENGEYKRHIDEISHKFTADSLEYIEGFMRIISTATTVGILKAVYRVNRDIFGDQAENIYARLTLMESALDKALSDIKMRLVMDDSEKEKRKPTTVDTKEN